MVQNINKDRYRRLRWNLCWRQISSIGEEVRIAKWGSNIAGNWRSKTVDPVRFAAVKKRHEDFLKYWRPKFSGITYRNGNRGGKLRHKLQNNLRVK